MGKPPATKVPPAITLEFDKGWQTLTLDDKPPAQFSPEDDELLVKSNKSVAFYYRKLPKKVSNSHCEWRVRFHWEVFEAQGMSSQRVDRGDDRPLAVHLWVNDGKSLPWWKRRLAKMLNIPTPGTMLTFSWGLNADGREWFPNPHLRETGLIRVLRTQNDVNKGAFPEDIPLSRLLSQHFPQASAKRSRTHAWYLVISSDTEDNPGNARAAISPLTLIPENCDNT